MKRATILCRALLFTSAMLASASPGLAGEAGDWLVRLRGIAVVPTDESGGIAPDLLGAGLEAQPAVVPELDITYMATPNVGLELILATTPHNVDGTGSIAGLGDVADVWLLPPTLLLQWHFLPDRRVRPYVGAGLNYTIAYSEDADASLEAALGGATSIDADNSFGWAVQAGVDVDLKDNWFANIDVKYVRINLDLDITTGAVTRTTDVDINPVIFGVGIGYRF